MTSCPPTLHLRSPRFRSEAEVVAELGHLALVVHRDPPGPRATQALPDLRVTLGNVDLPDQKAPEVFRVLLDLLAVELEEPLSLVPKDREAQSALLDRREIRGFKALPDLRVTTDFLAQPEQTVNPDLRVRMARLVLLALRDHRVLLDLLENAVLPVRMRLPRSSTSISPRMRQLRPTERRLMSKMHSDRPTHSRTVLGTTLR